MPRVKRGRCSRNVTGVSGSSSTAVAAPGRGAHGLRPRTRDTQRGLERRRQPAVEQPCRGHPRRTVAAPVTEVRGAERDRSQRPDPLDAPQLRRRAARALPDRPTSSVPPSDTVSSCGPRRCSRRSSAPSAGLRAERRDGELGARRRAARDGRRCAPASPARPAWPRARHPPRLPTTRSARSAQGWSNSVLRKNSISAGGGSPAPWRTTCSNTRAIAGASARESCRIVPPTVRSPAGITALMEESRRFARSRSFPRLPWKERQGRGPSG